jgi:acyl-[acyl-carrier-protein]-phospholipid O-acyltransferase/long-chain-fatty-acid--[acyl-carrier-protein] ligase
MVLSLLKLFARLLYRVRVGGVLPTSTPDRMIVIANHQSFGDAIILGLTVPFELTWIVHTTIAAKWYFRIILKQAPHLVVDVANPLAMKAMARLIEEGKPVAIFPEGRLTPTGSLMKVYDGLAFLAARTGAHLLPVWIEGAIYSKATRHKPPFPQMWRAPVTLTFFPLETLPIQEARTGRERRRKASNHIRRRLEEMSVAAQPPSDITTEFLRAVDLFGRKRPLVTDTRFEEETFGQLLRGALALGRLTSRHSSKNERVGVLMPNATATAMLLLGLIGQRRIPAMLNYSAGVEGMKVACEAATLRKIFTSHSFVDKAKLGDKLAQLVVQVPGLQVRYLEDLRPELTLVDKLWLALYALPFPRAVMLPGAPDDPAVVLFTSGSEGRPKGVLLSHRNILANCAQARAMVEFSYKDKFLSAMPLFHSFGLTAGLFIPLLSGARIFFYPSPLHYRMIPEMAYDQDCTVILGTPTFLANYARFAHPYDFYVTRYVVAGAEKLNETVRQTWVDKFGIRILEGYGVTECAPLIAVNAPYFYRPGSLGRVVPGLESKLEPVEGIEQGGILHVRGPNVMLGYLRAEKPGVLEPPSSIHGPGWYSTGDVVDIDSDGLVHLIARLKRFAKVAGEMISLEVVEQIAAFVSSRAHGVIAIPNERRGESIVLYTEDAALRRDQLLAAARQLGLPEVAVPRSITPIDKLPRLGSGKVDYVSLKTLALQSGTNP